ncbi:bifunctional indole-3-glycerol-phosphate synthase TrpC/phosphoribosylanthranilate isomerase TrpF [Candidatus Woesearchaeota archaeon]|nr:bifunctional indole-3-glycerol-phosphate synthase TrpC/phosphoribosylanthranilate isomerase TrpF [Candidatus Woesearchaeota archaeon]
MLLKQIVDVKKKEVELIDLDFSELSSSTRNFKKCLRGKHNIIAEIKHRSPTEGHMNNYDVKRIARIYDLFANAISVVTDCPYFDGRKDDIQKARAVSRLPVLRKDFIIDEKQILESRYYGADAILLIAAILTEKQINKFIDVARKYKMDCLVEVHTEDELKKVLKTKAEIIGINNRDLRNFKVDINTTKKLKKMIPKDKVVVSESGFNEIEQIKKTDVNAVLIGSALMKAADVKEKLASLRKPKVKICGITNLGDAMDAVKLGADFIGFNFYKKSPRYIEPEEARKIIAKMPNTVTTVGIFVNEDKDAVDKVIETAKIDMLQFHGNESQKYCESFSIPVIKAFQVTEKIPDTEKHKVFGYLFDSSSEGFGGSGKGFDKRLLNDFDRKLFVSGGINVKNIRDSQKLNPYCIDICSGVEKEKGRKDKSKMEKIICMVKS